MNSRLIYKDYLVLKHNLNIPEEQYEKLKKWDELATEWLKINNNIDRLQSLRVFVNNFLILLPQEYLDIENFFKIDLLEIDLNELLEKVFIDNSEKIKKYYKNTIVKFIGFLTNEKNILNIFIQDELYSLIRGDCLERKECLDYIIEWNNIEEKYLILFVNEIYNFLSNKTFKIHDFILERKFSLDLVKKEFRRKLKHREHISQHNKLMFGQKFSNFIDWMLTKYFPNILDEINEAKNDTQSTNFIVKKLGNEWVEIQNFIDKWLVINHKNQGKHIVALRRFFLNMFKKGDNINKFYNLLSSYPSINIFELMRKNNTCSERVLRNQCTQVINFFDWYIGNNKLESNYKNPFILYKSRNPFFKLISENGVEWSNWAFYANQWLLEDSIGKKTKSTALLMFFNFCKDLDRNLSSINLFIGEIKNKNIVYSTILEGLRKIDKSNLNYTYFAYSVCSFINWVIIKEKSDCDPIEITNKNFGWVLLEYGAQWLEWVLLAERWLAISNESYSHKKQSLKLFFKNFLISTPTQGNVSLMFNGTSNWNLNEDDFYKKLIVNTIAAPKLKREYYTTIVNFFDWVITEKFSDKILNPISKITSRKNEPIYLYILEMGHGWAECGTTLKKWIKENPKISHRKVYSPLKVFFDYLNLIERSTGNITELLDLDINKGSFNREKYYNYLKKLGYTHNSIRFYIKWPCVFLDYILEQKNNKNYFNPLAVTVRTSNLTQWFVHKYGIAWKEWCNYAEEWLSNHRERVVRTSIVIFLEIYLIKCPCHSNVELFFKGVDEWVTNKEDIRSFLKSCTKITFNNYFHFIKKFTHWVFNRYFSNLRYHNILPPYGKFIRHLNREKYKFQWFKLEYGEKWSEWVNWANKWILTINVSQSRYITSLSRFFEHYLVSLKNGYEMDEAFISKNGTIIDKKLFTKILKPNQDKNTVRIIITDCQKFFDWIIKNKYKNIEKEAINPFGTLRLTDGRTKDLEYKWFVNSYGDQWERWRTLSAEWISTLQGTLSPRMRSISLFLERYLALTYPEAYSVEDFFSGEINFLPTNEDLFNIIKAHTNIQKDMSINLIINYIVGFIDWILTNYFSEVNNHGFLVPKYLNPFRRERSSKDLNESVYSPLPYNYIRSLMKKLCPSDFGDFKDWKWAYSYTKTKVGGGWYDVPLELIDFNDPDCVWRKITVKGKYPVKFVDKYQIWSPVAAIGVYLKLHLPLRTYQARMLDSGEADEERYEKGKWVKNLNSFAIPNLSQGVFKKITDLNNKQIYTGFFINTNKTSDLSKLPSEKGYVIPWENHVVLYWLEKLRNWQEKYNKITSPTPCTSLNTSHLGQIVAEETLKNMGNISFLLRHAAAKEEVNKVKPIHDSTLNGLWLNLLIDFEEELAQEGQTFSDGSRIKFVEISPKAENLSYRPLYPLHSLRVSFITSYLQDGKVPLPIMSKLLAGHASLLMTLYYTKISPNHMQTIISDAQKKMEDNGDNDLRIFLRDHTIDEIQKKMVFQDTASIASILQGRNILGWEQKHHGICLAAGNTLNIRDCDESTRNAGCWNGGRPSEIVEDKKQRSTIFEPVPHGAGNCVRCRWFITHISYIPQLVAHFNILSYKANLSAVAARKANDAIIALEKVKQGYIQQGKLFTEEKELERLFKEYKLELTEADEYCKDIIATLNIIERINTQENNRENNDQSQKVIAVGNQQDIEFAFSESKSELLHLCILCDDAEIYPDLYNKLNKTPAIERRTRLISKMMIKKGYEPHYLFLTEEEQFKVINSMIREMSKYVNKSNRFESFSLLVERLEQESLNSTKGILDEFLNRSDNKTIKLIDINDIEED